MAKRTSKTMTANTSVHVGEGGELHQTATRPDERLDDSPGLRLVDKYPPTLTVVLSRFW